MAKGTDTSNHPNRKVGRESESAFTTGRNAVRSNMLPLPPSAQSANDFNEGYDYEESRLGVPQQNRNTFPRGQ
jgi:hypothetical protein